MRTDTIALLGLIALTLMNIIQFHIDQDDQDIQLMEQLLTIDYVSKWESWLWDEKKRQVEIKSKNTELEVLINLLTEKEKGRRPRAFWSIRKESRGFWEFQVLQDWDRLNESGRDVNNYIRTRFREAVRMDPDVFISLVKICEPLISKKCTVMRKSISAEKRLAIFLDWLGHGSPLGSLARTYDVGRSTVHSIVHDCTEVLFDHLVHQHVRFPEGTELTPTMQKFHQLCFLPGCVGALDGTFIKMEKPTEWGDRYFCYKKYCAIILLACVDANGLFTYIHAGTPGQAGDAAIWNKCSLHDDLPDILKIPEGHASDWMLPGTNQVMQPFIVADSAFALSKYVMKCYEVDNPTMDQFNFNYAVIRTRRVVECAFGRLKARFPILKDTRLRDPDFVSKLVSVCCAIHNMIEKGNQRGVLTAPGAPSLVPDVVFDPSHVVGIHGRATGETSNNQEYTDGGKKREALARHVRSVLNIQPALQTMSNRDQRQHLKRLLNGPVGYTDPKPGDLFAD